MAASVDGEGTDKKSRCLHEDKVLPLSWIVLNVHVQMSVCVISSSKGPKDQIQLLQVLKLSYLVSMARQDCVREVLTSKFF